MTTTVSPISPPPAPPPFSPQPTLQPLLGEGKASHEESKNPGPLS